jgi:hypothetical protein
MRRLLIGGDSHTVAIGRGLKVFTPEATDPQLSAAAFKLFEFPKTTAPFFAFDGQRITWTVETMARNWALLSGAEDLAPDHLADTTVAMCLGFTTTKFLRRRDWRRNSSWRLRQLKLGLVSDALIAEMGLDFFRYNIAFFAAGRALGLEMIAIEAPPVRADEQAISNGAPAENILDIDKLVRAAVRAKLEALGVIVLSPPKAAYDKARFLKPDYCKIKENDFHHANEAYGLIVLRQLYDTVGALHPEAPRVGATSAVAA